jgi:iron(III) transport system substrate-binding protein
MLSSTALSRRKARPVLTAVVTAMCLAAYLAASACGAQAKAPPKAQSITLYNGQHPETTNALVTAFQKATGITVKVRDGDEDVLANQIVEEGKSSPADVIYTENSQALQFLQGKGLLAPVSSATLAKVAPRYNSPGGDWVGVSARVSVMVYNTKLLPVSELPTSVMQLEGSKWAGKIGLAPSETDFQPIITSVAHTYGQPAALRWLNGLKKNAGSHIYPDNETLTAAVNNGQVALGLINHYYWYRLGYEVGGSQMHSKIAYFAPHDPGYVLDISGAAVLRSSHDAPAAQRFLAFLVSKAGQEIIAHSHSYEYPIGSGVVTAQPLKPFDQLQPIPLSIAELGNGSTAIALLHEAQLL